MKENTKHILRKAGLKLLLLTAMLAALDVLYYFTFYPKDLKEHCSLMALSEKAIQDDCDIIYLGESSNHSFSEADTDKRFICMMIDDLLPMHKVCNMAKDACHAGIYYDIMRNIPRHNTVKTAIVTVNMRSFSSEWINSNLETALRKEQVMMKQAPALYKRMLLAFKAYTHWSEEEREQKVLKNLKQQKFSIHYQQSPGGKIDGVSSRQSVFPYHNASEWDRAIGTSGMLFDGTCPSADTIALACHYIKDFAYQLDGENPRIKDLDKIVKLCHKRGWKLIFNILADNMDQINALVGPELAWLMEQNNQYIIDHYQPQGVTVVNNYNAVRDEDFLDRDFPTEHYTQTGRLTIASNIATVIE